VLIVQIEDCFAYISNKLNTEKAYYEYYYDEIIIPEELCGVHYKAAIQKRNRWMVDRADCLIAYLFRDFGGAYETVKYAKKQGKPVINLAEQK
jgi:nucleoside 2-deoxyribosyltransferase